MEPVRLERSNVRNQALQSPLHQVDAPAALRDQRAVRGQQLRTWRPRYVRTRRYGVQPAHGDVLNGVPAVTTSREHHRVYDVPLDPALHHEHATTRRTKQVAVRHHVQQWVATGYRRHDALR